MKIQQIRKLEKMGFNLRGIDAEAVDRRVRMVIEDSRCIPERIVKRITPMLGENDSIRITFTGVEVRLAGDYTVNDNGQLQERISRRTSNRIQNKIRRFTCMGIGE